MSVKIDSKIVGYKINNDQNSSSNESSQAATQQPVAPVSNVIQMHETLERPDKLIGSTYKLKTPAVSEHAMYITINDIVLNEGTEHELRRPFEVFINSKNLDHFQWIVALTRIMSAVFRKGGDVTFLVEELRSVFDPRGGYWNKGKYMPSIIAEIGDVIEQHLIEIGMIKTPEMDQHLQDLVNKKKAELSGDTTTEPANTSAESNGGFPENATLCNKCSHKAAVIMDGCVTCLNCGDSKCG